MFKDMVNVAQTDSFIATLIPRSSFQIAYTDCLLYTSTDEYGSRGSRNRIEALPQMGV